MTNLQILLKNNLNILLGGLQGKKQRKSTAAAVSLLILGMIGIFALYTWQAVSMFNGLGRELGLYDLCMFHGIITALSVTVIIGVMRMAGNAKHNDSDLLLSLPIKKRDIIIAKTINKYLFDLFFSALMLLPYTILYQTYCKPSAWVCVCGVIATLSLPLLSVGISYILDFITTRLFNRMKSASLIKSLFSTFVFILIMALLMAKTFTYGTVQFESMEDYFSNRFFSNMFLKFIIEQKTWAIIGCVLLTVIPFIVGMFLYSINFGKSFSKFASKNKQLKFNKERSLFANLLRKEFSTYVTTPAWVVNTIIGPISILVVGILFATVGKDKILQYFGLYVGGELIAGIIVLIFCALLSMTTLSCCSVSLEGKNVWILKTSPINEKQLFTAKSLVHFVICEPFIIISSIIVGICIKMSIIDFAMVLLIPTLLNAILATGGVFINLCFPKLDFDDETKVVKQSLATLLSILFGMILTALLVGVYYLFKSLALGWIALIGGGIYAVILAVVVVLLMTVGVKKFREL